MPNPDPPPIHLPDDVLEVFRRHLWLIALITTLAVAITGWLVIEETPRYQASAMIRLTGDPAGDELVALTSRMVLGGAVDREGLRLFSASIGAPAGLVEDARVSLPLEQSGTIHLVFGENRVVYGPAKERREVAYGDPILLNGASFVVRSRPREKAATLHVVPRETAIDYLLSRLLPIPNPSTGSVEVVFTSTERRIASRTVNAVVEVYQEARVEMARQDVRGRRALLEDRLRATDSVLRVVQTELVEVQSRELQAELHADLAMYENLLEQVLQARNSGRSEGLIPLGSLPGIAGDPIVGPLYSQLMTYRAGREALLTGPSARASTHPDVQRLSTLIASVEQDLTEALRNQIGASRAQIAVLTSQRSPGFADLGDPGRQVQEMDLLQEIADLQRTALELRSRYLEVGMEEASETGPIEIVELSTRTLPLRSNAWIKLLLGVLVGLVVGGAVALAREVLPDALHTREQVEKPLPVPNLAVIPEVTPYLVEPGSNGEVRPDALQSAGIEAYRTLRTNLLSTRWGLKTLVVTSAHPGEGKTTTSTNLAATYARQGLKVVLIECDLRRPSLGRYFGISKEIDLTDVLFGNHDWRQAIQLTKVPGLYVLLGEKSFPRAGELLGGPEMKRLLDEISHEYDMVILDTSPLLVATDAIVLGPIVDGVLLVVRATRTDRRTVEQVVDRLGQAGAAVVGTVLNDPEGAASRNEPT